MTFKVNVKKLNIPVSNFVYVLLAKMRRFEEGLKYGIIFFISPIFIRRSLLKYGLLYRFSKIGQKGDITLCLVRKPHVHKKSSIISVLTRLFESSASQKQASKTYFKNYFR